MKKLMKSLLLGFISLGAMFSAASCVSDNPDNPSSSANSTTSSTDTTSNIVKIKSLTASETTGNILESRNYSPKALSYFDVAGGSNTSDASSESHESAENNIQYIVIYKSISQIKFTIKLDNPEAYGIDAIRLSCDDANALIKIEGSWKEISVESDGTRIVNWSSEDAYEKTYDIKLTSTEYLSTLSVKDIRLAGHQNFQSKESNVYDLGKNELKIYRMNDTDITFKTIYNKPTSETAGEYCWKFETANNITDIEVDDLTPNEHGEYVITEDQTVKYTFYIEFDGVKLKWSYEKEIRVYKIYNGITYYKYETSLLYICLGSYSTDYTQSNMYCKFDGVKVDTDITIKRDQIFANSVEINIVYDKIKESKYCPKLIEIFDYEICVVKITKIHYF